MDIQGLGYVGVRTKSLEDWTGFAEKVPRHGRGLDTSRARASHYRMDDRKQRLVVARMAARAWPSSAGRFPTPQRSRLSRAAGGGRGQGCARHTCAGRRRRVADLISSTIPSATRSKSFTAPRPRASRSSPAAIISGFRAGPLGMGHAVLHVKNINDVIPFYRDLLGFRLSDYMTRPFNAYFFHANPRHHSIAFIETGRNATHHLMVELFNLDDVGQCYDLAFRKKAASASHSAVTSTTR